MALNLPFSSPFKIPLPRRFVVLILSGAITILFLHTFAPSTLPPVFTPNLPHHEPDASYFSPSKWLPPILNPNTPSRPLEFDEEGQCLFLSPFDALSPAEKARAQVLALEEISAGIVRAKAPPAEGNDADPDFDDEFSALSNETRKLPVGLSHPILGLLRDGEVKWNAMLAKQSKTLDQAVDAYVDKWGRQPPKGFDEWWIFAQANNVLLPDEYDAIMESLLPFYALPIESLKARMAEAEKVAETFTLIVHDGKVELQWNDDYSRDTWWASRPRADSQINLMEPFIKHIGAFRATFTIHDQPSILLDKDRETELLDAARKGRVVTSKDEIDRPEQNWHKACAEDSPLNKGVVEELSSDTFISSHLSAMDICEHPAYMENHGMLLEEKNADTHPKPHTKLLPIFVPSKTALNGDIPVTPIGKDGRRDDVGHDPDWSKKSGKLYWRGLATGLQHNKGSGAKWRQSHRERLHFLANDKGEDYTEVLSPVGSSGEAEVARLPLRELGQYYMDVKLAGGHWQCDWDDGTCEEMNKEIDFAGKDSSEKSNEYKYVFDTDGNAWSSRFPRLMASNNVVIKSTVFPEWNTRTLPEWYAYIPSKMDYSDLFSIMTFFRGNPSGRGGHDEVARRIALNGQCWVERTWRREDLQAYMFRLYLEYARLVSPDRDTGKMDYVSGHAGESREAEEVPVAER
ncbi:beta-1,2-xylosyltransferase 1 [Cryptococcus amylolentus CBS 6039]|uniref:Beta-1,2-xylosyltransferase 1 n=2 Tax=Cryptococcus amylolentus TaxID=104669 RepID=A0A1E3HXG4_9TREE|nr:beta-1,2-xylosyltransferase 1 [Cryptococcus amylolentus CBS 6039]ODN80875.1 beta-1,2-xylosyltransferase 1 [Cryptococcus amylolentus CBS 6039]ODO09385.1 beta-1,2-xylosyltransferase 1 [Cryptococcus amylolentus CBS 6273]